MAGAGYRLFATGDVLTAAQVNTYLQQQTVMVFADSSARTTALSGVLAEGMVSYLQSDDTVYVYNGSAWVSIANSGDITSVVAGNGLSGGATSGAATLTIDTAITVDKTTSQTLTNKTLTSPIISSISNTGTLTLPTSTDTLVGRATTDTLTNKTLTSPALTTPTISTLTTNGDLLYGTGSGALSRLGIGSSNQVLTVASGVPSWATPSGASGPTFQAQRASDQSIAAGTWVKLQLTQENWDTAGCYDNTTNYRFTPTTAGYYQVNMRMYMGIDTGGGQITAPNIYKNGVATNIYVWCNNTSGTTTSMSAASGQLYFNGSTDYIEMFGFCNTGTTRNVGAGTYMDAVWIRS